MPSRYARTSRKPSPIQKELKLSIFYPSGELCQPKQEISSKCNLENNQKGVIFATDCHHLFIKSIRLYKII